MKIAFSQSFAGRLSIWIMLLCILIFVSVIFTNYYLSRSLFDDYIEELVDKTTASTVEQIETVFNLTEANASSLASVTAIPGITENVIHQAIRALLPVNARTFGMAVALEPKIPGDDPNGFAPYYFKQGDGLIYKNLATSDYDYTSQPWYEAPKKSNAGLWSEPYFDEGGGNVQMITYSMPIYSPETKTFLGIATADIRLTWLEKLVDEIKIGKTGYGYIVSGNNTVIAHPDRSLNMKNLADIVSERIQPEDWQKYLDSKSTLDSVSLKVPCPYQQGDCRVAIESLANTGWKVIIVLPEQDHLFEVNTLTRQISYIALSGIAILLMAIFFITRRLTTPLANLANATRDIGAGKLDIQLPAPVRQDEIGVLTSDFNAMRTALKTYIAELQATTAKQQKLESEIQIARDIQMSMIPGAGKVFIENDRFQLYALLRPAMTVGGDLYYFQQSGQVLQFIIGDVSDKGVPAALFMARTVTLYTHALRNGLSPGQTFTMMNDILAQDNDACMFVTALCGTIDLTTGAVVMSNAGHMNPIIQDAQHSDEYEVEGAVALGLMDGVDYPDIHFQLQHQASLLMYTDGVSEAHDSDNSQYSTERLLKLVADTDTGSSKATGTRIIDSVDTFAGKAAQFDDITILIIRYE